MQRTGEDNRRDRKSSAKRMFQRIPLSRRHMAFLCMIVLAIAVGRATPGVAADKINLGVLKISGVANAWVARDRGMFQKNGLEVNLVEFRQGAQAINAGRSGDVDIMLSIAGGAMTANERGFDLVGVFQNEVGGTKPPDSGSIQSLKGSGISTLADLNGKKIAVSSLNSQQVIGAQVVMKRGGVDLSTVQFFEMPFPALANALKAKHVDAVVSVDPFTTQLITSGVGNVLSWCYVESIPAQPVGVWWAKRSYVEKNPKIVEAFNRAMKESIDYMNADIERARDEVSRITGLKRDFVSVMPAPGFDYNVRPEKWQQVIDMLVEYKVLTKPHKAEEYFAPQIKSYIVQ